MNRQPEVVRFVRWTGHYMITGRGRWSGAALLTIIAAGVAGGLLWLPLLALAAVSGVVLAVHLLLGYVRRRIRVGGDEGTQQMRREQARLLNEALVRLRSEQAEQIALISSELRHEQTSAFTQLREEQAERLRDVFRQVEGALGQVTAGFSDRLGSTRDEFERRLNAALERVRLDVDDQVRGSFAVASDLIQNVETMLDAEIEARDTRQGEALREVDASIGTKLEALLGEMRDRAARQDDALKKAAASTATRLDALGADAELRGAAVTDKIEALQGKLEAELADLTARTDTLLSDLHERSAALSTELEFVSITTSATCEQIEATETSLRALAEASLARAEEAHATLSALSAQVASSDDRVAAAARGQIEAAEASLRALAEAGMTRAEEAHVALSALAAQVEAFDDRLAGDVEARLAEWRNRLDNEIKSAIASGREADQLRLSDIEAGLRVELEALAEAARERDRAALNDREDLTGLTDRVDELRQLMVDAMTEATRSAEAVSGRFDSTAAEIDTVRTTADQMAGQIEGIGTRLEALVAEVSTAAGYLGVFEAASSEEQARLAAAEQAISEAHEALEEVRAIASTAREGATRSETDTAELRTLVDSRLEAIRQTVDSSRKALEETAAQAQKAAAEAASAADRGSQAGSVSFNLIKKMAGSNAGIARPFERMLSDEKLDRFQKHWLPIFGLNMSRSALGYLAHQICLLEDRGAGRIAAPIETIVLRQLALRSLRREELDVLEIGTLFGLGAAALHQLRGGGAKPPLLTLIDPLEGYYDAGAADPTTGIIVSEATLRANFTTLGIADENWRLIKRASTDKHAIDQAADRLYDFVLIDGDHSTVGVAADYANYAPMVRPGGLLVFDDYGSDHWPGIQPFVDEQVRGDPGWTWLGGEYRTGILARRMGAAPAA